jgi:hypothetical protein
MEKRKWKREGKRLNTEDSEEEHRGHGEEKRRHPSE